MTYDEYVSKVRADMQRLRGFELWVKKYRFVLISVFFAALVAVVLLLYFSGTFLSELKDARYVYGEKSEVKADTFLSRAEYTYTDKTGAAVAVPYKAGSYGVTAATQNPFGIRRSANVGVTIEKRSAKIELKNFVTVYGDEPELENIIIAAGLANGDRIEQADIEYDRFAYSSAASISSVKIVNADGEDVTDCYELQLEGACASVRKRPVTVRTGSAEKVYDGAELICNEYEITEGSLNEGDRIDIAFTSSVIFPTESGGVSRPEINEASVYIFRDMQNGELKNVTGMYELRLEYGALSVKRIRVGITTGSYQKKYDGKPAFSDEYTVDTSALLPGHSYKVLKIPEFTDAASHKNEIVFGAFDTNGNDVSALYDFSGDLGTVRIDKRKITLESASAQKTYDGSYLTRYTASVSEGALAENDTVEYSGFEQFWQAGEYSNTFTAVIRNGKTDKTKNYDITYKPGRIVIEKRYITVRYTITGGSGGGNFSISMRVVEGELANWERIYYISDITLDTPFEDFPKKLKTFVYNDQYETYSTGSYVITEIYEYDEKELEEYRSTVTSNGNGTGKDDPDETGGEIGTDTGAGTGKGDPDETSDPDDRAYPDHDKVFGPSGIGSQGIGGGISNSQSPYSGLPSEAPDQSDEKEVVGAVYGTLTGNIYLRLRSFGNYTGSGWAESAIYMDDSEKGGINMAYLTLSANRFSELNRVKVEYYRKDGLFPVPYYSYAEFDQPYIGTDIGLPSDGESDHRWYSQIPMPSIPTMLSLEKYYDDAKYDEFVYENYLSVPEQTKKRLTDIIRSAGLSSDSPTVIEDVAEYVKNAASYNGSFDKYPEDADRVIYFLTEAKEGICSHFASAAVLIYRSLGIPARYTVGYYAASNGNTAATYYYEKDAHAWAEVYVSGIGWIPVEVTGSGSFSEAGASSMRRPPDVANNIRYNVINCSVLPSEVVYDGNEHSCDAVELSSGSDLLKGHTIKAVTGTRKYAGSYNLTVRSVTVVDEKGNDVTELYDIRVSNQTVRLKIEPYTVTLPETRIYVGQTIKLSDAVSINDETAIKLTGVNSVRLVTEALPGISVDKDGSITGIYATENKNGRNFDLGASDNEIIENPEVILYAPITVVPFENIRVKSSSSELMSDKTGSSVTVVGENGRLYNYIAIRSHDAEKYFDGKYLTENGYSIVSGGLKDGHELYYRAGTGIVYAGSASNNFEVICIRNKAGDDVTHEYIVEFIPGTLTVDTASYSAGAEGITVTAREIFDLRDVVYNDSVHYAKVVYSTKSGEEYVRIQGNELIGIDAGTAYLSAKLEPVDLNGDGIFEFDATDCTLRVNILPAQKNDDALLYIVMAVVLSMASTSVVLLVYVVSKRKNGI